MLGPGLLALLSLLIANGHVSRRKMQSFLLDVLNVRISLGALSESEAVVGDALTVPVAEVRAHAMAADVKHADGTTWYRAHIFRALWVMATKAVTVFTIFEAGTIEALKAWMGEKGILVSDRGSQLSFWAMKRRQICWAHLIRKFAWYSERRGEARQTGLALLGCARFLMHEWHRARDGCISRETFRRNTVATRDMIEFLLRRGTHLPGIDGSCAHILAHRDALWRFVSQDGVEPTNNHAYAARGISVIMPPPEICRVGAWSCDQHRASVGDRTRHNQRLWRNERRASFGRNRVGAVPEISACAMARSLSRMSAWM